jgi:hypothetical protein
MFLDFALQRKASLGMTMYLSRADADLSQVRKHGPFGFAQEDTTVE